MRSKTIALVTAAVVFSCLLATLSPAAPLTHRRTLRNVDYAFSGHEGVQRNHISGFGVPVSGTVTQAFLYWHGRGSPYNDSNILFGTQSGGVLRPVQGVAIGQTAFSGTGYTSTTAYEADVTAIIQADGPGFYLTTGFADCNGCYNTGFSLVIVFDDGNPGNNRDLYFYGGNDANVRGDDDGWHAVLSGITYSGGPVKAIFHVGEGENFPDNTLTLSTAGSQMTIPDNTSRWDGNSLPSAGGGSSAGSLWDIHTIDVTAAFGSPGDKTLQIHGQLPQATQFDAINLVALMLDLDPQPKPTPTPTPSPTPTPTPTPTPQPRGGAISNRGELTLANMVITGNSATDGGGVYNSSNGSLRILNSTVSGNTAAGSGGGVHIQAESNNFVTIENSTISGNTAANGGGLYREPISVLNVTLSSTTIANNTASNIGGGANGTMSLRNTLVANNNDNGTAPDYAGTVDSQGYNLIENLTGTTVTGDTTGNLTGLDPNLGPLLDNGGLMFTHALLEGSPAIDQGASFGATTDQRGVPRPFDVAAVANGAGGDGADIGAFEVSTFAVLEVQSAVSRKTHGTAGTFDINLPLTGAPGVECRSSAGSHTLVFQFSNDVVSGSASVTNGIGSVSGAPIFSGKTMTVNLTGVGDVQQINVTATGVTDNFAQVLPNTQVTMNLLIGDTNGNKFVNASDIGQTKSQSGVPVTSTNLRQDVTPNGSINASDIGLVKSRSGAQLP